MDENKQKILDLLVPVLRETRHLYNVVSLEYDARQELIYAKFASGVTRIVNVAGDSGTEMIRDVIRQIA